ncbi:LAQU0S06e04566g1_1 [Lachancea quebecensis]|uniref:LAQU0S06e04566g1_1 n=1 Tax=Lachancea quebecensis TaxID=1654605 RepID=A0A0P1KSL1_9SACH|nr:LAQU0S06e04566g1_1 [Lachancea quebecensis]
MSVCLAVTKTVAVSSLGIYCGMLTSACVASYAAPVDVLTQLARPARAIARVGGALAAVSSAFFALSYFGAPAHWRHPYLIYGMLVAPVSAAYVAVVARTRSARCRRACEKRRAKSASTPAPTPASAASESALGDSVVDLGAAAAAAETAPEDHVTPSDHVPGSPHVTPSSAACARAAARHVAVLLVPAAAGLLGSVLGLYGEGLFV